MNSSEIEIPITSRYFTHGTLASSVKHIWIVCHGYGQLAQYFIKKFEGLNPEEHYVIAPEGMNRFYLEGFSGRVGATWMTKEDRETDILNYCKQLNAILNSIPKAHLEKCSLNLFGFSQGTATISRWMEQEQVKCTNLLLWAGKLAHEIDLKAFNSLFKKGYYFIGNEDQFSSVERVKQYVDSMRDQDVEYSLFPYDGQHAVDSQLLEKIAEQF